MPDAVSNPRTLFRWRRLDVPGLEILSVTRTADGVWVHGQCIDAGDDPFGANHKWSLDHSWQSKCLHLIVNDERHLRIERIGDANWQIDGRDRPDLDGCEEVDLSFTPVCNSLALRRHALAINQSFDLTTLYVRLPDLFIAPSRQRYVRTGEHAYRFIDLGVSAGFEATLQVDGQRMIRHYEGLFETLDELRPE
jgi:hypothetical protein